MPWYENVSFSKAATITSIASSITSRLMRSASAWSGLSNEPIWAPSASASRGRHGAPTDAENTAPAERLCSVEKSSAKRNGCHCGTMWNMAPILIRDVRSASTTRTDPVGDDLVALVLEVVLGQMEHVEPETFGRDTHVEHPHRSGPHLLLGVATVGRRRRAGTRIVHLDCAEHEHTVLHVNLLGPGRAY